jgi:hypothetical protein
MKYAALPLGAFAVFFLIPKLFQFLINAHSDFGIVIAVTVVCVIASIVIGVINKIMKSTKKENVNED